MDIFRPMSEAEYVNWLSQVVPAYAADKVESGQWSEAQALALSQKDFDELLPQGLHTKDNYLYTIIDTAAESVGSLWFAVTERLGEQIAYVYDISIELKHQRKGHGYRAFLALEHEVQKLGLTGIGLHVFGKNMAARALYTKLGFQPTNIHLFKPVPSPIP